MQSTSCEILGWMKHKLKSRLLRVISITSDSPTLCDPIDGSPTGSSVPGILQTRILEWVAISFSNAWKWKMKVKSLSRVRLLATPWTVAYQAPPSMGFSRQEYWSGVPLPSLHQKDTSVQMSCIPVTFHIRLGRTGWEGFSLFTHNPP